jgi:hypothetical protein
MPVHSVNLLAAGSHQVGVMPARHFVRPVVWYPQTTLTLTELLAGRSALCEAAFAPPGEV